jgi:hypothetical protein
MVKFLSRVTSRVSCGTCNRGEGAGDVRRLGAKAVEDDWLVIVTYAEESENNTA